MVNKKTETTLKNVAKTQNSKIDYILELKNITKTFLDGKVVANDDISLSFVRNKIHALVGENGSGKSTLMNILFGLYKQDKGDIFLNGKKVDMYSSKSAKENKIGMVHQHFHLVENFTVLENIILGQESLNLKDEKIKEFEKRKNNLEILSSNFSQEKIIWATTLVQKNYDDRKKIHEKKFKISKIKRISKGEKHNINSVTERALYLLKYKDSFKVSSYIENLEEELISIENVIVDYHNMVKKMNDNDKKVIKLSEKMFFLKQEKDSFKTTGVFGYIKYNQCIDRFSKISKKYKINLEADANVSTLPVGKRQMVEIMKVLWDEKNLIVFDEPTATLSVVEIKDLMETIKLLKKEGKTIIFISHKLKEVKELADTVSILRKGELIGTHINDSSLKLENISKEMVGKIVNLSYPKRIYSNNPILKVDKLCYITGKGFKSVINVSFEVNEGEIFGLAGIEGNGQEEVLKMISGLRTPSSGKIDFLDFSISRDKIFNMNQNLRRNISSSIPIDRYKHGMVSTKDLLFNASISDYDTNFLSGLPREEIDTQLLLDYKEIINKYEEENSELKITRNIMMDDQNTRDASRNVAKNFAKEKNKLKNKYSKLLNKKENIIIKSLKNKTPKTSVIKNFSEEIIKKFKVEGAYNNSIEIRNLSGGNQQKFVVGREILRYHKLLLAGHPTRGLDIAAIDMIYKKIIANAKGKATILYSLEISELIAVCDRIAIMYKGEIVGIIDPKKTSMGIISNMMIGIK